MDQAETGHEDELVVVGEIVTDQIDRCPSDLVDFVGGSELASHRLHHPVADPSSASLTVGVAHLGELFLGGASQSGLLADFPERALERGLASPLPAFGERPVLSVRSVDDEYLVVMQTCQTPHDPASGLDHTLNVRFGVVWPCGILGERRPSRK